MKKLLREPLFHFVLLGIAIFVANELINAGEDAASGQEKILVTEVDINRLKTQFERTWQRPPEATELSSLVDNFIREEVYYRQALALGLDQDDLVIRRRLRQKMEFLSNDMLDLPEPTNAELESFRQSNQDQFTTEPVFSFDQVYFDPRQHEDIDVEVVELRERLNAGSVEESLDTLGDNSMLPTTFNQVTGFDVARYLGRAFVDELEDLETGRWQGPVRSGYGLHLIKLKERIPGQLPPLSDIREQVVQAWQDQAREVANEAIYQRLLDQYQLVVQGNASIVEQDRSE